MRIYDCQINHLTNPLGYQMESTVFSWKVADTAGKHQQSARLRVACTPDMSDVICDTGAAALDSIATALSLLLKPRTRYYWTVEVTADNGDHAISQVNWFETAKREEPWRAKWITCQAQPRHPVFTKQIAVTGPLESARLYISGLGVYEARINGQKVGDEYLAPYCNNYHQWIQYQTYDVTQALSSGGTLCVTVGNGWYASRMGYFSKPGDAGHYGTGAMLIAEIVLRYADGTEEVVCTDESWHVKRSCITDSSIYDGETRDDTLPQTDPEPVTITQAAAPLVERYSRSVRVQETVAPIELIHTPAGELVLDLGQNLVGTFALRVKAEAGSKIFVQVGEVMQNGCFYNENLRTAKAEYTYISDGVEKTVIPTFTFYGFRYVKIEGLPDLKMEDFTALVLYSDLPQAGEMITGHEKVNRLIRNVQGGQKGNFLDVPTDCPQRDERLGWTGDAQVFSATACYLRQCYPFYRKYLHDMATEQQTLGGMVPDIVPSLGKAYQGTACVWGDACTIIPWNLYQMYGDKTILAEQFESMAAWVDYITSLDGEDHGWSRHFHYGDWLALDHPDNRPDQCMGGTDVAYISQIYYRNSAKIVADTAALLGKQAQAEKYAALADRLTQYLVQEFFAPNGRCCIDTQTGLVLALRNDLSPNAEKCAQRLAEKLAQTHGKLQTGFVGTPFLCSVLTDYDMAHQAYQLLLNEDYPGWLYAVNLGATTIWERWNSMNPDGSVSSTGMNSFNHYAYGAIFQWLAEYAAGLKPATPGFRRATIAPVPHRHLGSMDYRYDSAAGQYRVRWEAVDDQTLRLWVQVPFGCEAELKKPYCDEPVQVLTAGSYEFTCQTNRPLRRVYSVDHTLKEILADAHMVSVLQLHMPGILQIPDSLKNMTLREILTQYADTDPEPVNELLMNI